MLTQTDLNQIRGIIKEEVKEEVAPVRIGLEALDKKLDRVQADINQKLDRTQEDISEILIALDKHQTKLETRVDRLEVEVGIATS